MTAADPPNDSLEQLQHTMQRKLGLCMLILQQYERQIKRMIGASSLITCVDIEGQTASIAFDPTRPKTLGQLMDQFMTTVLVPMSLSPDEDNAQRKAHSLFAEGKSVLTVQHQISMDSSRHDAMRRDLVEIVSLRNELVHHFIDKFDLWSEAGCRAAEAHLDQCYAEFRASFTRLRQFAQSMHATQARAAEFIASDEFGDFYLHGILPGGAGVDWPRSTIVRMLSEAEEKFAEDGWALLETAIQWITLTDPAQIPEKYGCISWPQVLHVSKLFEIRKSTSDEVASKRLTHYRSRKPSSSRSARN